MNAQYEIRISGEVYQTAEGFRFRVHITTPTRESEEPRPLDVQASAIAYETAEEAELTLRQSINRLRQMMGTIITEMTPNRTPQAFEGMAVRESFPDKFLACSSCQSDISAARNIFYRKKAGQPERLYCQGCF